MNEFNSRWMFYFLKTPVDGEAFLNMSAVAFKGAVSLALTSVNTFFEPEFGLEFVWKLIKWIK